MNQWFVLGLGSNVGDRLNYLRRAVSELRFFGALDGVALSPLYGSDALLPDQAPLEWNQSFLNMALLCQTSRTPQALLQLVKEVEKRVGRQDRKRWGPREIDIDLLLWSGEPISTEELTIPHPGLKERPFALLPALELPLQNRILCPSILQDYGKQWKEMPQEHVPFRTSRFLEPWTQCIGILNLTPDSFSDGGSYCDSQPALHHMKAMIQAGAAGIDLGAESTRPGASLITPEEEWRRLEPLWSQLPSTQVSLDSRHASTFKKALSKIQWINMVAGLEEADICEIHARAPDRQWVIMHHLGMPASPQKVLPQDVDPLAVILQWGMEKIQALQALGIPSDQIIFDPGIGFGKTARQNWEILKNIHRLQALRVRILVGHSRKAFLTSSIASSERDLETAVVSVALASRGVDYLRVHSVRMTRRALSLWSQMDGVILFSSHS